MALKRPQFDQYAKDYESLHRESVRASGEEPSYFAAYKVAYMARRLQGGTSPESILDFGCGIGGTIGHLKREFPNSRLHGADVSEESLVLARASHPDVDFAPILGDALPQADASVDVALAACVFHHIPPASRLKWARELKRVLKPGGQLFIFEHNPLNPLTRKVVRECPFDEDAILLPSQESRKLLDDAGFRDNRLEYVVFFPKALSFFRPLEKYLGTVPLGAQYAACGQS